MIFRRLTILLCLSLAALNIVASALSVGQGVDNLNMMTAFESDEPWIASQLLTNLQEKRIDPHMNFTYGYTYQSVGYGIAWILQKCGFPNDIRFSAVLLRLVSLLASVLTAVVLYALSRKAGLSKSLATVCGSLLFLLPDVAFWSQLVHPDLLQLLFITLALWNLVPPCSRRNAFFGSIFAGLAFGTKYGGVFVLPFTVVPYLVSDQSWPLGGINLLKSALKWGIYSFVIFLGAFFLSNPTAIVHARTFLFWLGLHWGYANVIESTHKPLGSLLAWISEFGMAWMLWLAVGLSFLAFDVVTRLRAKINVAYLNLGAYFVASFFYVFFVMKVHEFRYGLHLVPIAILFGAMGWFRFLSRRSSLLVDPVTLLFAMLLIPLSLRSLDRVSPMAARNTSAVITEGMELPQRYPIGTRVLTDYYVYIPPAFQQMKRVQGVTSGDIQEFRPDVLILSKRMTGRWIWPAEGARLMDQKWMIETPCSTRCQITENFLKTLVAKDSTWKPVFEGKTLIMFERL